MSHLGGYYSKWMANKIALDILERIIKGSSFFHSAIEIDPTSDGYDGEEMEKEIKECIEYIKRANKPLPVAGTQEWKDRLHRITQQIKQDLKSKDGLERLTLVDTGFAVWSNNEDN